MKTTYLWRVDEVLKEKLKKLADKNKRSMSMEILIAVEKHLEGE